MAGMPSQQLFMIRMPPAPPRQVTGSAWAGLAEGVRYAWKQPVVRALLIAVAGIRFFDRSYTQLMPIFA